MKQVDEGLFAMVSMMGGELGQALEVKMDHISENAIFFDEHTCGASTSINSPSQRIQPGNGFRKEPMHGRLLKSDIAE